MKSSLILTGLVIIFWGLWAFFGKLASGRIGIQLTFWSFLVSIVLMYSFLALTGKLFPLDLDSKGIMFAILSGVSITIGSIIFYILLAKNPAGILVATTSIYPLITIILSVIFLRESVTFTKIIGTILAVFAVVFLSL